MRASPRHRANRRLSFSSTLTSQAEYPQEHGTGDRRWMDQTLDAGSDGQVYRQTRNSSARIAGHTPQSRCETKSPNHRPLEQHEEQHDYAPRPSRLSLAHCERVRLPRLRGLTRGPRRRRGRRRCRRRRRMRRHRLRGLGRREQRRRAPNPSPDPHGFAARPNARAWRGHGVFVHH
jgi:hypothetical protein